MYLGEPIPYRVDIIVVGAGLSGMVAAHQLLKREPSLDVIILEASDCTGGRIRTIPMQVNGNQVSVYDFGGQWISSSQMYVGDLIKEFGLKTVPQYNKGNSILELNKRAEIFLNNDILSGVDMTKMELKLFLAKLENLSSEISFTDPCKISNFKYLDSLNMDDFIKGNLIFKRARKMMKLIIKSNCGVDAADISVLFYLCFCNGTLGISNQFMTTDGGAKEFWILGGAQELCTKLIKKIGKRNIFTKQRVTRIHDYDNDEIKLSTTTHDFICTAVILAVPPKQALNIEFNPSLTKTRRHLLENYSNKSVIKFVATYETAFWRDRGFSGEIICQSGPVRICYDVTYRNHAALTGLIWEETNKPKPFKIDVLLHLARYFGSEALEPIQYLEKNWCEEPHINGCPMSCPGMNTMNHYRELRQPVGRLFWAGTETATQWNGYMDGAVQAGYRAAIEVLYDIRPQALNYRDIIYTQIRPKQKNRYAPTFTPYGSNIAVFVVPVAFFALFAWCWFKNN